MKIALGLSTGVAAEFDEVDDFEETDDSFIITTKNAVVRYMKRHVVAIIRGNFELDEYAKPILEEDDDE